MFYLRLFPDLQRVLFRILEVFFPRFKDWDMLLCEMLQDFLPQMKQKLGSVHVDG